MTSKRFSPFLMAAVFAVFALCTPGNAVSQETVRITSAEITQALGLQKDNHRYFVAGKNTAIRAFLSEAVKIDSDKTSATVFREGSRVFTLSAKSTDGAVSTVDFLCESLDGCQKWEAGTYTFSVTVNGATFNLEESFAFVAGNPLRILAVPIKANYGSSGIKSVTGEKWKTLGQFTEDVYPLAVGNLKWSLRLELFDASSSAYNLQKSDSNGDYALTKKLSELIPARCKTDPKAAGCHDFVVGFIPESVRQDNGEGLAGWAYPDLPVVVVVAGDEDAAGTVAHELAHKFGIGDTYDSAQSSSIRCSVNPAPDGFKGRDWDNEMKPFDGCTAGRPASTLKDSEGDRINGAQVSAVWHPYEPSGRGALTEMADFMSAGGAQQRQLWITQDNYDWLYGKLVQEGPTAEAVKRIRFAASEQRFVSFSGDLLKTGEVRMDPWKSYSDTATLDDTTGSLMVQAIDRNGNIAASAAFTVQFFMVHPPRELTWAPFDGVINFPPDTVKFQIVKDGAVLAELPVSASPPVVGDVAPRTPTTLDGVYTIAWTGSDPDQDDVTYTVAYTPDITNPDSPWIILADDLSARSWQEDFSLLPGGAHAAIQVTAGDGVLCSEAESAQFVVPFKAPEVFIDELPWGNIYKPGSDILLVADVFDLQDESIPNGNIVWTSNISGELGSGNERIVKNLPRGVHVITATAVNSAGLQGSDTVTVTVSDDGSGGGGSSGGCFIDSLWFTE